MSPLLLALLAGVTALLLVGAEGPAPDTPQVGAGGLQPGTPRRQRPPELWEQLQLGGDGSGGGAEGPQSLRCALCKRVVTALKDVMVNPKDKAGVAHVTQRVCGRLRVGAGLCRRLLHHALVPIEAALRQHQDPAQLCAHLGWCSPKP